jgi:hypothetical protein
MVRVARRHGSAEQQQNRSHSLHLHVSLRLLFVMKATLGLQAGGVLRREDALVYRASLSNETNAFEITLRDKLNDFAHGAPRQEIRDDVMTNIMPSDREIWGPAQICNTNRQEGGIKSL